eukprot:9494015-Pyramimonas_sp.AAC.1
MRPQPLCTCTVGIAPAANPQQHSNSKRVCWAARAQACPPPRRQRGEIQTDVVRKELEDKDEECSERGEDDKEEEEEEDKGGQREGQGRHSRLGKDGEREDEQAIEGVAGENSSKENDEGGVRSLPDPSLAGSTMVPAMSYRAQACRSTSWGMPLLACLRSPRCNNCQNDNNIWCTCTSLAPG